MVQLVLSVAEVLHPILRANRLGRLAPFKVEERQEVIDLALSSRCSTNTNSSVCVPTAKKSSPCTCKVEVPHLTPGHHGRDLHRRSALPKSTKAFDVGFLPFMA